MKHLLLSVSLIFGLALHAADPKQKEPPAKTRPFHGTIKAVDKTSQSIVLRGEKAQTFKVIPETKIRRDGKPITFAEILVGESLGGFARQAPAGHWEALTLNFGKKTADAANSPAPGGPAAPKKPATK